jgi:2-methylcitrate dehydratase PrpD
VTAVVFIHDLAFTDLPEAVVTGAERRLIDLLGVAAAGIQTNLAAIARRFAAGQMAAGERGARMLFDGRRVSPAGALTPARPRSTASTPTTATL